MANTRNRSVSGRGGAPSRSTEAYAALAAFALIALIVGGGALLLMRRPVPRRVDLLVAADVTGSVHQEDRRQLFGVVDETVSMALPKGSPVEMWSFDVNAHKFSSVTPSRPEDLWPDEDNIMKQKTSAIGTYPAEALKEMTPAVELAQLKGHAAAIMILTDGEDQDPKRTETMLKQLSGIGALKAVWFSGARSDNGFRSQIERRMGPILGDRLIVTGANDAQDGLNQFRALLTKP